MLLFVYLLETLLSVLGGVFFTLIGGTSLLVRLFVHHLKERQSLCLAAAATAQLTRRPVPAT